MKYVHKTENQEVEVLKYLEKNSNHWITSEEISERLQLSKVTTNKLVKSIQSRIRENQQSNLVLEIIQNKGILFCCTSTLEVAELIQHIYSHSLVYKLITALLNEQIVSLEQFAYQNFVSLASVRRRITYLNEVLKESNISIRNNRFVGEEKSIRGFLFKYYWEINKGRVWPFSSIDKNKLIRNSERVSERLQIWCSSVSYEQIYYILAISRIRLKKSHQMEFDPVFQQLTEKNDMYTIAKEEWYKDFPQRYCMETELQYYFFIISSFSLNYVKTNVEQLLVLKKIYAQKKIFSFEVTIKLFERVSEIYNLQNIEERQALLFLELVMCHSKAYIIPSNILVTSLDKIDYTTKMSTNYPKIYRRICKTLNSNCLDFPQLIKGKRFLLETYCMIYFQLLRKFFLKKIKVLVSITGGRMAEKRIIDNLAQYFKESYVIEEVFDEKEADICITDGGQFFEGKEKKLLYVIDSMFSEKDYQQLEQKLAT